MPPAKPFQMDDAELWSIVCDAASHALVAVLSPATPSPLGLSDALAAAAIPSPGSPSPLGLSVPRVATNTLTVPCRDIAVGVKFLVAIHSAVTTYAEKDSRISLPHGDTLTDGGTTVVARNVKNTSPPPACLQKEKRRVVALAHTLRKWRRSKLR